MGIKKYKVNGKEYRLYDQLNDFQLKMYTHLVNWKWKHITKEPGGSEGNPNDAQFPVHLRKTYPMVYGPILNIFKSHLSAFPFKVHPYLNHVASSQAANANLFFPIIKSRKANQVFKSLKPDFKELAIYELDRGFKLEYWDEDYNSLNDHSAIAGTDSDIAIAYYNNNDELCLWLIEHKLTEDEFTTCGGAKSKGRTSRHSCDMSIDQILANKSICYYHSPKRPSNKFNYWDIMSEHTGFFKNDSAYKGCPFKGGENQLWRNILIGLALESNPATPFKHVYFSVVKHPDNGYLDNTIGRFKTLIDNNSMFSVFTSRDVIKAAMDVRDEKLNEWIDWYKNLYII